MAQQEAPYIIPTLHPGVGEDGEHVAGSAVDMEGECCPMEKGRVQQ